MTMKQHLSWWFVQMLKSVCLLSYLQALLACLLACQGCCSSGSHFLKAPGCGAAKLGPRELVAQTSVQEFVCAPQPPKTWSKKAQAS